MIYRAFGLPVPERAPTPAHKHAGLPGWVSNELANAVLSADPAAAVDRIATSYRAVSRYIDANIIEDQARAFGILPRSGGAGWATTRATTMGQALARVRGPKTP